MSEVVEEEPAEPLRGGTIAHMDEPRLVFKAERIIRDEPQPVYRKNHSRRIVRQGRGTSERRHRVPEQHGGEVLLDRVQHYWSLVLQIHAPADPRTDPKPRFPVRAGRGSATLR